MPAPEQNRERWVCLFASKIRYKAEILKGLLEESDIPAVIINKQDSAYLFGDIEVYVNLDHVLRAQQILKQFLGDE
ncbi:MAG: DUF2007 domain-containing protein [Bacteroidales bacterium]|nr:DUF2007 domain-containing protein [Bacteroidales bacterium]